MYLSTSRMFFQILFLLYSFSSRSQEFKKMPDDNYWTTKNLNLIMNESYCYNDSIKYCQKYGRLYTWTAAIKVCELLGIGWHLPSTDAWNNLLSYYGSAFKDSVSTGKNSFSKLLESGNTKFNATLGGNRNLDGSYSRLEAHGFYWTSTEYDDQNAGFLNFANGRKVLYLQPDLEKKMAISVRCIKNEGR